MDINPEVAVIVPVFNVEKYLKKCLDSIVSQTYKNLEIVLVDDGSQDKSGEICDAYASRDSRIKVFHNENRGPSYARNFGIDHSCSPYILFIDSDDYLELDYIEYLMNLLIRYNTKISCCDAYIDFQNKSNIWHKNKKNEYLYLSSHEAVADMLYSEHFDDAPWGKLYHRDLFRKIRYPEERWTGEDASTTYKILLETDMIVIGRECKYHYVLHRLSGLSRSGLDKAWDNEKKIAILEAGKECIAYISAKAPEIIGAAKRRYIYHCFWALRRILYVSDNQDEQICSIMNEIKRYRWGVFFDKRAQMRDKIAILLSLFGPAVFKVFWSVYSKIRNCIG